MEINDRQIDGGATDSIRKEPLSPQKQLLVLIKEEDWDNEKISEIVPEWKRLSGENGYRHNGQHLGLHTKDVVTKTRMLIASEGVSMEAEDLAILSGFWHDFGQETGGKDDVVPRNFDHKIRSVAIMRQYSEQWGMAAEDIDKIETVIILDGVASDIARGNVRDPGDNLTPAQMAGRLNNNLETHHILRAVNHADVLATVGDGGWWNIRNKFNEYFDQAEAIIYGQNESAKMEEQVTNLFEGRRFENRSGKIRNLWINAMYLVDKVRCRPFLGAKDAEVMAGFSRLMREEGQKFELDRWLGVNWRVDKKDRSDFLRFVRVHDKETLRKLIKVNSTDGEANAVFTYSFDTQKDGLERLAENNELLDFGLRLGGLVDIAGLTRIGIYVDNSIPAKLDVIRRYQFGEAITTDPVIYRKFQNGRYSPPEVVGPIVALANYPEAENYIRNTNKKIYEDALPLIEFASTDPEIFRAVIDYIENNTDEVYLNRDLVKVALDSAKTGQNVIAKKLAELVEVEVQRLPDNYGSSRKQYVTSVESIFQELAPLVAQMKRYRIPPNVAMDYIDSFPLESLRFDRSGYVIRFGEMVLKELSVPENAFAFQESHSEFGNVTFMALSLGKQLSDGEKGLQFAEALNVAGTEIKKRGEITGFEAAMWENVAGYLATHPERTMDVLNLLSEEEVRQVIFPGGILSDSYKVFFNGVFESGDIRAAGLDIAHQFSRPNTSYSDKVYFYALHANADVFENRVPAVPVVKPGQSEGEYIDFNSLDLDSKKAVLRATIERSVERTRSNIEKDAADLRNRNLAQTNQISTIGVRLHGSDNLNLPRVLRSGNFSGECLTKVNEVDSYPFCVDYVGITEQNARTGDFEQILIAKNAEYGTFFAKGMVLILTPSTEVVATQDGGDHLIKFAAEEATNISGVILTKASDQDETLTNMKMEIAENGFYVPIYDTKGNLLFTDKEYDSLRSDYHFDLELEYWDGSLKAGEQLGSNPGGIYLVPEENGPERYYVKYLNSRDRSWCEYLASAFYNDFGVAVPIVQVRNVDGRPAVTSKWIDTANDVSGELRPLKDGFIMDAWMANWDIPWAKDQNTKTVDGGDVRLDNGGALLFRANAGLKDLEGGPNPFTDEVPELTATIIPDVSGTGMRAQYNDLSDDEIKAQAVKFKNIFTDEVIDRRVENTQMSPGFRRILKQRLKSRRDYILKSLNI